MYAPLRASDTLTLAQCRALAVQNSPLQQKKGLAESTAALQIRSLESNNLPKINLGAQASWQSDVFGLPISFPGVEIPKVPKDQYKLTADVSERIWDGRLNRTLTEQKSLEKELTLAQTEVDVYQIRELVTDFYCKALLLQESVAVLESAKKDLEQRLKQAEAGISEGIALRTTADQILIQLLKNDQQIATTAADFKTLLELLAIWIGRPASDFAITARSAAPPIALAGFNRPEYHLFDVQAKSLQLNKSLLQQRTQPRLDAFAQTGLGNPNPLNFFDQGFSPFLLIGLRAAWTPIDWGNTKRDQQVLDIQAKNIEVQKAHFEQRLQVSLQRDQQDALKYQALLKQDDAIIALQTDIISRADAQLQNGVMTATDYLTQLNLLTQAKITRKTHEMQALQARELQLAKNGDQ
jgi:outer membrane protein TolC